MMKWIFGAVSLLAAMGLASCTTQKVMQGKSHENLIIYYDPGVGNENLLRAAGQYGSEVIYVYKNINGIAVTVPDDKSIDDAVRYFEKIKGVLSVTEDRKMQLDMQ